MKTNFTIKNECNSFKTLGNKSIPVFLKPLSFLLVLLFSFNTFGQSAKCIATLKVEKDRNTSSTSPEGCSYIMILSNHGSSDATYVLSAKNTNSNCVNSEGISPSTNVNLTSTFADANLNSVSKITLLSGQTTSFIVTLYVPIGTAVNKWNCTEITATSSTCPNYKVSTILHTLVSDPSQE